MKTLLQFFKGHRTYIMVVLGVLTVAAHYLKYISMDVMTTLLALEGFGSIAALRAAITGVEDKIIPLTQAVKHANAEKASTTGRK